MIEDLQEYQVIMGQKVNGDFREHRDQKVVAQAKEVYLRVVQTDILITQPYF